MKIWVDAQLPPAIARWLTETQKVEAGHGPPPPIIWLTCGNTSNVRLQEILGRAWSNVVELLTAGEQLVEVGDRAE